ncbi:MAG: FISUMP domain-containing protein, partial [Bacteroidales bacterium]|nr:FISUMP domain-containing protein [Bacteroidales bacterium]
MRKIYFVICFLLAIVAVQAQNYEITFNAVGEGNSLDSVLVQNITQETQLLIPGDAVLHLVEVVTNSIIPSDFNNNLQLFPNPMKEFAMFEVVIVKAERINIDIFDITGKLITSFNQYYECGRHQFKIQGLTAGIYTVNVSCDGWRGSANLVSIGVYNENPTVEKIGMESIAETTIKRGNLNQEYQMQYNDGEVLVFTGYSGINSTVSTLIPTESQAVTQNIVSCVDPDGYSYSTVTIGDQIWMAENLRYLPSVNYHQIGSSTENYYYVYNYDGSSVASAKNTEEYQLYGALYNRPAALISCPTGWHLPSHFDWVELEREVCMSQNCESDYPYTYDAPVNQGAIEGSILAGDQDLWQSDYYIPGVYNEPLFSTSGFLARPGGYSQVINEGFFDIGAVAKYWASDVEGANGFVRYIHICNKGVYRDVTNGATGSSVRCVRNVDDEIVIPTVCTQIITSLTETSAISGGVVTNSGFGSIESQGIVWSTSPDPEIGSNIGITDEGNEPGDFASEMTSLNPGTIYYVRAYAINSAGAGYGEQVVFETLSESSSNNGMPCPELSSVYYDGYSYPTIQFGDRCWLAENLKYLPSVNEPNEQSMTLPRYYVYDYYGSDIYEAQMSENYETYGVLYNFPAAKTACPNGWYLPYNNDWTDLEREVCITDNCDLEFLYGEENLFSYEGTYEGSRLAGNNDLWINNELTNNSEFGQSGFNV